MNKKINFTTPSQINKILQQSMGYTITPSTIEAGVVTPHNCKGDCSNITDLSLNGEWNIVSCKNALDEYVTINISADNYHLMVVEFDEGFKECKEDNNQKNSTIKFYDNYAVTDLSKELQDANRKEFGYIYDRFLLANIKREKRSEISKTNITIAEKYNNMQELLKKASLVQDEIDSLNDNKKQISQQYKTQEEDVLNNL